MNSHSLTNTFEQPDEIQNASVTGNKKSLILHNDDFHSFEFVIQSLIEICNHTPEQAEQCTTIVHFKGSCDVKTGNRDTLLKMHQAFTDRNLITTIK